MKPYNQKESNTEMPLDDRVLAYGAFNPGYGHAPTAMGQYQELFAMMAGLAYGMAMAKYDMAMQPRGGDGAMAMPFGKGKYGIPSKTPQLYGKQMQKPGNYTTAPAYKNMPAGKDNDAGADYGSAASYRG